eukprot:5773619-Karenia_brevis.AAC.1
MSNFHTNQKTQNRYTSVLPVFAGLATLPCHGLVDTGAQDGVCGFWHFQRWCACLAIRHGLRPRFIPVPESFEAGGIGRGAKLWLELTCQW